MMDFKSLREDKLKLSKEDFSELFKIDVSTIEELERTNEPSVSLIEEIVRKTGLDFNAVLSYKKPAPKEFNLKDTYEKADFTKRSLVNYIRDKINLFPEKQKNKYIVDLQDGIQKILVKPSVAIVGRSDTGKSTLINALLGMNKMPTDWTPTTSAAVYIKHVKDKPDFIKEDVWVFADKIGNENLWDVKRLYDKEYCEKWRIAQGDIKLLKQFGTRQGENFKANAGSAVVFLDAPVLVDCDIVDLPGFGTEKTSDDAITFQAAEQADVLIYLSQANGFMRIEDITYLKENIRNLPAWEKKGENEFRPLSNLFIVASQAHTVENGNQVQLNKILKTGCENFKKTIALCYWKPREKATGYGDYAEILESRFFTYTTDIPALCETFEEELKATLEKLPEIIQERAKCFINEYVKTRIPGLEKEIKTYQDLLEERENYKKLLKQIDSTAVSRAQDNDYQKQRIRELIETLKTDSIDEFSCRYSKMINVDALVKKMREQQIKNKSEDIQCFASRMQDELQVQCDEVLSSKSQILSEETKKYIENFERAIQIEFEKASINIGFDAGFAFASGLAKLGIVGGLGAFIAGYATFAVGSMSFVLGLGGTIALGALGLGPIGVAIGLLIAASLGVVKLFGGSWQKSVARKLVQAYDDNRLSESFRDGIRKYWDYTDDAFIKAAENLDEKWKLYVDTLRDIVNNYDVEEIENNISLLQNLKVFFENIPL